MDNNNGKNLEFLSEYDYYNERICQLKIVKEYIENNFSSIPSSSSLIKMLKKESSELDIVEYMPLFIEYIKYYMSDINDGLLRFGGYDIYWKHDLINKNYLFSLNNIDYLKCRDDIEYVSNINNKMIHLFSKNVLLNFVLCLNRNDLSLDKIKKLYELCGYYFYSTISVNQIEKNKNSSMMKVVNNNSIIADNFKDKDYKYFIIELNDVESKTDLTDGIVLNKIIKKNKLSSSEFYEKINPNEVSSIENVKLIKFNKVDKIEQLTFSSFDYVVVKDDNIISQMFDKKIYIHENIKNVHPIKKDTLYNMPCYIVSVNYEYQAQIDLMEEALFLTLYEDDLDCNVLDFNYKNNEYKIESEKSIDKTSTFVYRSLLTKNKFIEGYSKYDFIVNVFQMYKYLLYIKCTKVVENKKMSEYNRLMTRLYLEFWKKHNDITVVVENERDIIRDNIDICTFLENVAKDQKNNFETIELKYFQLKLCLFLCLIELLFFKKPSDSDINALKLFRKVCRRIENCEIASVIMYTYDNFDVENPLSLITTGSTYKKYVNIFKDLLSFMIRDVKKICEKCSEFYK